MAKEIIKTSDVEQVAMLSRLEFSPTEIEGLKKDLGEIVAYFGNLSSVQTEGVPAVNKPEGALREDEKRENLTNTQVVKNAPHHNHNAFIVPRVVD